MTYPTDLLDSASKLLGGARGRPRHSNCNRAVSTVYYAVFDCLCRGVANKVIAPLRVSQTPSEPWAQVYRSIDHGWIEAVFRKILKDKGPVPSVTERFAIQFLKLKDARNKADYDPAINYNKVEALLLIEEGKRALELFQLIPRDDFSALTVALVIKTKAR